MCQVACTVVVASTCCCFEISSRKADDAHSFIAIHWYAAPSRLQFHSHPPLVASQTHIEQLRNSPSSSATKSPPLSLPHTHTCCLLLLPRSYIALANLFGTFVSVRLRRRFFVRQWCIIIIIIISVVRVRKIVENGSKFACQNHGSQFISFDAAKHA